MKKLVYILFTCLAISCTHTADNATLTKSREKQISSPAYAQVIMTMSPSYARMYFGSSLPEFEFSIPELKFSETSPFVKTDDTYTASVIVPNIEHGLYSVVLSIINKDKISLSVDNTPLNPQKPTVFDFEMFLRDVNINITIDPNFTSDL